MKEKLVYPHEIIVWDIAPLLRREFAFELKHQGFDQKAISKFLSVTEPTISHYFNEKRASLKIKIGLILKNEILKALDNIKKDKTNITYEIQRLLVHKEVKHLICLIHKKEYGASKDCNICLEGTK